MAGESDQFEQETYDEGRLSERIMLAAAAFGVGSSVGWFRRSGERLLRNFSVSPRSAWCALQFPWAIHQSNKCNLK